MLKRYLEAFFPGFSWAHGVALFGVAEAIGVGASFLGGMMGDDANEDAADQIGKANALTQQQIKFQQDQNTQAFKPYTSTGAASSNLLAYYLGLAPTATSGVGGGPLSKFDLINTQEGVWKPNEYLYNNDDTYHQAWNSFLAEHWNDYGENPNNARGSYETVGLDALKRYGFDLDKYNQEADARMASAKSNPMFGSLLSKFTNSDLNNDVVYNTGLQFGLDEGNKALERRAAANGGYDSGATLKALARYANDYGTTKAEGAYNRFMNDKSSIYNFLSGQQAVGLNATGNQQNLNTGLMTAGANSNMNAAQQQAQYGVNGAAALNNGIMGGIGNALYSNRLGNNVVSGGNYGNYGYSSTPPFWNY